jgi:hypothetical protein
MAGKRNCGAMPMVTCNGTKDVLRWCDTGVDADAALAVTDRADSGSSSAVSGVHAPELLNGVGGSGIVNENDDDDGDDNDDEKGGGDGSRSPWPSVLTLSR